MRSGAYRQAWEQQTEEEKKNIRSYTVKTMGPMKVAKKADTHVGDDEKEEEEFLIQTNRTSAWTQYIFFLGVGLHHFFFEN